MIKGSDEVARYRFRIQKMERGEVVDSNVVVATGMEVAARKYFKGRKYTTERTGVGRDGPNGFTVKVAGPLGEEHWEIEQCEYEDRSLRKFRIFERSADGTVLSSKTIMAHRKYKAYEKYFTDQGYQPEQVQLIEKKNILARVDGDKSKFFEIMMIEDRSLL